MEFPAGWLDAHPMTRLDLEKEAVRLAPLGFQLEAVDQSTAAGSGSKKSPSPRAR